MYVFLMLTLWILYTEYKSKGFFPIKDVQIPPPPLKSGHIYMKDGLSAESNEKSYFIFLFFELWVIVFTIYGNTPGVPPTKKKVVQKWENLQERCAFICLWFFSSWVFFVRLLVLRYGRFCTEIQNFFYVVRGAKIYKTIYKIDHISKTKRRTKKTHELKKPLSDQFASFL